MNQGIVVGTWDDKLGINVVTEYPASYRKDAGISDASLLDKFNTRIVQQVAGFDVIVEGESQIAMYYTPFSHDPVGNGKEEADIEHGIVFMFLDGSKKVDEFKEQFIEFSMFLFKLINRDDFPELFFNIIDNFAFLEPIADEQRYAAIYTDPAREILLKKLGEGPCTRAGIESWARSTLGFEIFDFHGLLSPFLKTGLVRQTIEATRDKKKDTCYYLVNDVYLFKIPPRKILAACKKGKAGMLAPFVSEYCDDVTTFFEDYELTPTEINKLSVLLSIPNLYKIIRLLRENVYELDDFRIDFLERYNYLPSNFNYLLRLLEKNDIINSYDRDGNKIVVLKTDIQFQVFFPEYIVDTIRKAWRENRVDKHLAIKHLTLLRDEYLERYIKVNGQARQKAKQFLDLEATSAEIELGTTSKGTTLLKRLEHVLLKV